MNEPRLEYLLDRYFDEALSCEEHAELESLLLSWPHARTLFWKRARFNALLRRRGREIWGRRLALEEIAGAEPWSILQLWRRWRDSIQPVGWWAAAGFAVLTLFLVLNWEPAGRVANLEARSAHIETTAMAPRGHGIATILRAVGVRWPGDYQPGGNVLGPGWLKFESGLIELQFHSGARVTLEGPAEFELITDMQARCLLGKVRAEVPAPAIGFEILSPNVRVVDRGTTFGFEVSRNGPAEVHVFSGKVDVATSQQPDTLREVLEGNAVRIDVGGNLREIPAGSGIFTSPEVVEQRANSAMAARFEAWKAHTEIVRKDPSLLVQYTFEDNFYGNRTLWNYAPQAPEGSHGTIVGGSRTEGRWPGKQALDFKQIGDRIRLALPRQYKGLTCITWIRLDALDRKYISLWMSGDAAVGELQWQLSGDGRLIFGKRKTAGWGGNKLLMASSEQILSANHCGSWMQLAFVYDSASASVVFYLDGSPLRRTSMSPQIPLTTNAVEIGNWTPTAGEPTEPIRAFNGRMDEFLVFSRALTAEEIRQHWEVGKPL